MVDSCAVPETKFGAYFHRDVPGEDAELTHVGPGHLAASILRRFWQPICFSDELHDLPNCPAKEELWCSAPRAAPSACWNCIARIAARRWNSGWSREADSCCYHGWLFATDGTILAARPATGRQHAERPAVPWGVSDARGARHCFRVYGAARSATALPGVRQFRPTGLSADPGPKYSYPCNWLQIMENAMDPAHTAFLHTIVSGAVFTEEFGVLPELDFVEDSHRHDLCRNKAGG